MKLILIPLIILIVVAISVQMINLQPLSTEYNGKIEQNTNGNTQINDLSGNSATFQVSLMGGFIALFTAIAVVGVLSGLNISVFGSTVQISERSQKLLFNSLFFGGIWGIFSVLATVGLNGLGIFSIPIFGGVFYLILTLFYIFGINQQVNGT
jgi:hypothetical protein